MYSLRRMGLRDGGGIIMLMSYLWRGEIFHSNNWLNAVVKNVKPYSGLRKSMGLCLRIVLLFFNIIYLFLLFVIAFLFVFFKAMCFKP